jgi:hypothetical protein
VDDARKCLVYPLMAGGSLGDRLRLASAGACPPLGPLQRVQIAAGTAKGLAELHSQGIIHRDVKSTNILLDAASSPLVADMGLCRVLAPAATHTTTRRMGTDGYIDPEYSETLELREQSDVYSFGVVVLELISNQAAYTEGMNPPGLVGRFRQHLRAGKPLSGFGDVRCGWAQWMVTDLGAVAEQCLKLPGSLRPKMRDVARMLDRISLMARTAELEARAGGAKQPLVQQEHGSTGAARPQAGAPQPQQPPSAAVNRPQGAPPPAQQPQPPPPPQQPQQQQKARQASPLEGWPQHSNGAQTAAAPPPPGASGAGAASAAPAAANGGGVLLDFARSADTVVKSGLADLRRLHAHVIGSGGSPGDLAETAPDVLLPPGSAEEAFQQLRANAADIESTITAALAAHSLPRTSCVGGWEQLVALISSNQTVASQAQQQAASGRASGDVTGLESVIDALRAHALTSSSAGAKNGGDALLALADGADSQLKIAAAGGVEAIVQTLRLNSSRPTVLTWATWALCELASGSAHSRAAIHELGGTGVVLAAMDTHRQHVGVQEQGCSLLALLARSLPADGAVCEQGALSVLLALQSHGDTHAGVAARGCWALGALCGWSTRAAGVAHRTGGVNLMHVLDASHAGNSGVQAHAHAAREAILRGIAAAA